MNQLNGIYLAARYATLGCLKGKRLLALGLLVIVPVVVAALAGRKTGELTPTAFHNIVLIVAYQFVIPISALLLGVGVLGDELEGRTITYLWTRPVGRGWIHLGRYIGSGVGFSVLFGVAFAAALHIRPVSTELGGVSLGRAVVVGLGGFWVYLAFFACLRTLLKRALVAGMFYVMCVDLFVSKMPGAGAVKLSIWHHLAVIHARTYDLGAARGFRNLSLTFGADETAAGSVMALAITGVVTLALGMLLVKKREYPVAGAVA